MRTYEHKWVPWEGDDVEDVAARLGHDWRFCGETRTGTPGGIWVRLVIAAEPAAVLMEISTQLEVLSSTVGGAEPPLAFDLARISLARGESRPCRFTGEAELVQP